MYNVKSKIIHVKFKNNFGLNWVWEVSLSWNLHDLLEESSLKVKPWIVGQSWTIKLDFCGIMNNMTGLGMQLVGKAWSLGLLRPQGVQKWHYRGANEKERFMKDRYVRIWRRMGRYGERKEIKWAWWSREGLGGSLEVESWGYKVKGDVSRSQKGLKEGIWEVLR